MRVFQWVATPSATALTDDSYPILGFAGCINLTDHKVRCGYGGGPGGQRIFGGCPDNSCTDADGISYAERRVPVNVSLNDLANDSQAGEAEFHDENCERVIAGLAPARSLGRQWE